VGTDPQESSHPSWRSCRLDANVAAHRESKDQGMPSASGDKRRPKKVRSAAPAKRGNAVDYQTLAQFRYELRRFQAFSEAAANRSGLTAQQHQALLAIRGFSSREPISIGDLARYLLIRHHTAVELVDRMVKLKILSRSVDPRDARRVLVQLTREGERRLQRLSRIHLEELRAIGPTLTRILKLFGRARGRPAFNCAG
jgi:DNA-binding MarR family transcriptional regulator